MKIFIVVVDKRENYEFEKEDVKEALEADHRLDCDFEIRELKD